MKWLVLVGFVAAAPAAAPLLIPTALTVTLLVFFVALLIAGLLWAINQWLLKPLQEMAQLVPVIGGYIADAVGAVVGAVESFLSAWLDGAGELVGLWFDGLARTVEWFAHALDETAGVLGDGLDYLGTVAIPAVGSFVTGLIEDRVSPVEALVDRNQQEAFAGIEALSAWAAATGATLGQGIDALGGRVTQLDLDLQQKGIDAIDRLNEQVLPSISADVKKLQVGLAELEAQVTAQGKVLEDSAAWVTAVAGAVTITQVIEGVRASARASRKLDRLCMLDLDEVEDLLGVLTPVLSLAAILAIVQAGQQVSELTAEAIGGMLAGQAS